MTFVNNSLVNNDLLSFVVHIKSSVLILLKNNLADFFFQLSVFEYNTFKMKCFNASLSGNVVHFEQLRPAGSLYNLKPKPYI